MAGLEQLGNKCEVFHFSSFTLDIFFLLEERSARYIRCQHAIKCLSYAKVQHALNIINCAYLLLSEKETNELI